MHCGTATCCWCFCDAGRVAEDAEMADVLDELNNPDAVTLSPIFAKAPADFQTWLSDRKNSVCIGYRMDTCGYLPVRNPADTRDGQWKVNGKRQTVYAKSNMSTPARIAAVHRLFFEG